MANSHFGNLADVFKHLVLTEVLGSLRPAEYWESHAGCASYNESAPIPAERLHGIHTYFRLASQCDGLRMSPYTRLLARLASGDSLSRIPGSPLIARRLQTENLRRMLFCDLDADGLRTIRESLPPTGDGQKEIHPDKIECVQDDGISVLRGAGMLLPEPWTSSTLAFLDPYDVYSPTDADIAPLDLACELANRGIATILFYTFVDDANRALQQERFHKALEKARLRQRGGYAFEGSLKTPPSADLPTQWGFGILTLNLKAEPLTAIEQRLKALESAYEKSELATSQGPVGGGWCYSRAAY